MLNQKLRTLGVLILLKKKINSRCYLSFIVLKSDLDFKQNKTRNSSLSSENDLDVNKTISFSLQNNELGALIALFKLFLDLVTFIFISPESHFWPPVQLK